MLLQCYKIRPNQLPAKGPYYMPVTSILHFEGWGFLYLLGAMVAYRLLTRQINLKGLFLRKDGSNSVSPERVQLLIATLAMSANYLSSVAHNTGNTMPDVRPQWLYLFGGSSGIYVAAKALTTLRGKTSNLEQTK